MGYSISRRAYRIFDSEDENIYQTLNEEFDENSKGSEDLNEERNLENAGKEFIDVNGSDLTKVDPSESLPSVNHTDQESRNPEVDPTPEIEGANDEDITTTTTTERPRRKKNGTEKI